MIPYNFARYKQDKCLSQINEAYLLQESVICHSWYVEQQLMNQEQYTYGRCSRKVVGVGDGYTQKAMLNRKRNYGWQKTERFAIRYCLCA